MNHASPMVPPKFIGNFGVSSDFLMGPNVSSYLSRLSFSACNNLLACSGVTTIRAFTLALGTWLAGQKYYPIPYEYEAMAKIGLLGFAVYFIGIQMPAQVCVLSVGWYLLLAVCGMPLSLWMTGVFGEAELMAARRAVARWLARN